MGKPKGRSEREHTSQCGQRASFNRDRGLADEPHSCSSVFGCRNACGVVDHIDIVEVDDIISYHDVVAAEKATLQKGMNYRVGKVFDLPDVIARECAICRCAIISVSTGLLRLSAR
jgi:hypothetical protein